MAKKTRLERRRLSAQKRKMRNEVAKVKKENINYTANQQKFAAAVEALSKKVDNLSQLIEGDEPIIPSDEITDYYNAATKGDIEEMERILSHFSMNDQEAIVKEVNRKTKTKNYKLKLSREDDFLNQQLKELVDMMLEF